MKKCIGRTRVMIFGIWMGLMMFTAGTGSVAAGDAPKPAAENSAKVTIRGSISNINDIGGYVVDGSSLQLYPCEITGKIDVRRNSQGKPVQIIAPEGQKFYQDALGRLVPRSELPRTVFPDFGSFSFNKIKELTPGGCYKICVKMLDLPYPGFVPLTGPDGKICEIIIPENKVSDSPQEIVIDLTKETLIVPDPSKLPQDSGGQENKPAGKDSGANFWK
jgi:hypothetical protein